MQPPRSQSAGSRAIEALGIAAVYYVTGRAGLMLAIDPGYATAVWAPSGIALAGVYICGASVAWGVWLGSFLVNLQTSLDLSTPALALRSLLVPSYIGMGAALQALFGAWLVRRVIDGRRPLDRAFDALRFLLVGGPVSCLANSTWAAVGLSAMGAIPAGRLGVTWWTWWLGDSTGVIAVAPLLLAWNRAACPTMRQWEGIGRALLLMALLALVSSVSFFGWLPRRDAHYPLVFLPIPIAVWAAYEFGQRGATLATTILSGIALAATASGRGPFARASMNESLLLTQSYMSSVGCSALLLSAAVAERQRVERELQDSHRFLLSALNALAEPIAILDDSGRILEANQAWDRAAPEGSFLGSPCERGENYLEACRGQAQEKSPDAGPMVIAGIGEVMEGLQEEFRMEYPCRRGRGSRWFCARVTRFEGAGGRRVVLSQEDVSQRKAAEEQLRLMATRDALTGSANRVACLEAIQRALSKKAWRKGYQFAVLFLDLDGFKAVNDRHGHPCGDMILVAAARRIQGCLRASDLLGRFGGDEFVILLDGVAGQAEAWAIAERIAEEMGKPFRVASGEVALSASIGIALDAQGLAGADDLIRNADLAMYRAKQAGERLAG